MQALLDVEISTRRGIMTSHREKAYLDLGYNISLPVSEDAADRSICIPLFVPMNNQDVEEVAEKIKNILLFIQ